MAYNKIEQQVLEFLKPIAKENGVYVWDIEFKKEGPSYVLRIFLDREGGIFIEDCEKVSRALSEVLDEKDPIPQEYMLEVSSAGLDRALKQDFHFEKCLDKNVDVKLFAPIDGEKEFTACLKGYEGGIVTLYKDNKAMDLPLDKISQIRLTVEF